MKYTFTINTDASVDPRSGLAAYAYYIYSDHFLWTASGVLKGKVANSSVAELRALQKALERVDEEVIVRGSVKLQINTDSMWAIQALKGNVRRSAHVKFANKVKKMTKGYEIEVRHVRAHTDQHSMRHLINNWCDEAARSALRKAKSKRYAKTKDNPPAYNKKTQPKVGNKRPVASRSKASTFSSPRRKLLNGFRHRSSY